MIQIAEQIIRFETMLQNSIFFSFNFHLIFISFYFYLIWILDFLAVATEPQSGHLGSKDWTMYVPIKESFLEEQSC
jgi:hypothetical protein